MVVATRERTRGRAVLELAEPDDPNQRFTLWPGLPPPEGPLHPSLAPRLLSGRAQADPVWLEGRPPGAPLNDVAAQLDPMHVALVLLDCCDGLEALHEAGRVHGDVKSKRVVLGEGGYATLIGVGQRQAHPEEDLAALIRLGRTLTAGEHDLRLPEVAPASAAHLRTLLETQLVGQDEPSLRDKLAGLSMAERAPIPLEPTLLQVVVEHTQGARGRMDELSPILGPETERTGSQISWSSSAGEVTRESAVGSTQAAIEGTGSIVAEGDPLGRRTQVFARILAPMEAPEGQPRFEAGQPSRAVRSLLEAGPCDPLPFAGELPIALPPIAGGGRPADISVTQSFRAAVTQIERREEPEVAAPAPRGRATGVILMLVAFVVGMVVGSALLYLYGSS